MQMSFHRSYRRSATCNSWQFGILCPPFPYRRTGSELGQNLAVEIGSPLITAVTLIEFPALHWNEIDQRIWNLNSDLLMGVGGCGLAREETTMIVDNYARDLCFQSADRG